MSFYHGESSLGTCNACGSPVNDGGQSGAYCSNNRCRNGWGGGGGSASLPPMKMLYFVAEDGSEWTVPVSPELIEDLGEEKARELAADLVRRSTS